MKSLTQTTIAVLLATATLAHAAEPDSRRSGFDFMTPQVQAMQRDDAANPAGMVIDAPAVRP